MPPIIIRDQIYRQLVDANHLNNHHPYLYSPDGQDNPTHRLVVNLAIPTRRHPQLGLT